MGTVLVPVQLFGDASSCGDENTSECEGHTSVIIYQISIVSLLERLENDLDVPPLRRTPEGLLGFVVEVVVFDAAKG